MYTIAICDDMRNFTDQLENALNRYAKEVKVQFKIVKFHDGYQLLEYRKDKVDLIFLDIRMPGLNGMQVAEKIRKKDKRVDIIFLTSLVDYAMDGYNVNAFNYILKPVQYMKLKSELDRWIENINKREDVYWVINNDTGHYRITMNSIKYIETYNRNLLVHAEQDNIVCYRKLRDVEEELSDYGFSRSHSGFLVNLAYVGAVEKQEARLISGEFIPISKQKKKSFMEDLAVYWGDRI